MNLTPLISESLQLLWPARCAGCDRTVPEEALFCADCSMALNPLCGVCPGCAPKPVEALESYFGRQGAHTCLHSLEAMGYQWKSGSICREVVPGRVVCWTVQFAPCRGATLTHASLPAAAVRLEGGREATIQGHQVRRFDVGSRVVLMGEHDGLVCVVVLDSAAEAEKFK